MSKNGKKQTSAAAAQEPEKKPETEKKPVSAPKAETGKNPDSVVRLTLTLAAICAVCALLLGLTNMVTKDRIAENKLGEKKIAMEAVLPSDSYKELEYTGADATIRSAYQAGDKGYVIEVAPSSSFSGTLTLMVGVDKSGAVTGVEVTESAESPGLGENAKKPEWRARFVGLTGTIKVDKDGGEIEALSGATITSRAVCAGVTSALAAAAELG